MVIIISYYLHSDPHLSHYLYGDLHLSHYFYGGQHLSHYLYGDKASYSTEPLANTFILRLNTARDRKGHGSTM